MKWQEEFKDSLKSNKDLKDFFQVDFPEVNYPIFLPRSFAAKILKAGVNSPLWNQFLPNAHENDSQVGRLDPIGDKVHAKNNQLIHRYENRVLFTPTTVCPVLCRYCFRKNELASSDEIFDQKFNEAKAYLIANPEINEVIFTGGDPFILSNEKLALYLQEFSEITSIKYVRFHTRTPIILPSRIDEGLLAILQSASMLFKRAMVMIHVNHTSELTNDVVSAINALTENHVEVFSQSVLLKGVNDSTDSLFELFSTLADLKVKPYYLHHPDEAMGAMHFHMSLPEGRKIFAPLHNRLPGWALPQYVLDIPGGFGKTPAFNPESFEFTGNLIDRNGKKVKIN
ncbi:MAG: KamA family radical SAM protein [Bdellovibrionales bacterium]|nr:KamA family radical SAM protein [Bdellovibrionales bacterium]